MNTLSVTTARPVSTGVVLARAPRSIRCNGRPISIANRGTGMGFSLGGCGTGAPRRTVLTRATDDDDIDILAGIDVSVLDDEDRERIEAMVKATMEKIKDDPEAKEQFRTIMANVEAERQKDPEGFALKMKQQQEMQELQMRTFIYQVCKLDENDPEVGHVVTDLKENGEAAFRKYAMDQQLGMLLQKKCMLQAVGEQILKIDATDEELGHVRTKYDAEGDTYVETLLNDKEVMVKITRRAVLDDPYALHGATRVGDLETMTYLIAAGRDVNAPGNADLNGAAPLHIASAAGLIAPASLLLDAGAELNLATPATEGNSPLHYAVGYGQPEMVEFLISKGANKYGTNGSGMLPADMAGLLKNEALAASVKAMLL